MQSAPTTLPRTPDGGLTSGIDWASSDHAVAVVNTDGVQVDRFITEHKPGSAPRVPPGTVLRGTVADPGELRRCWTSSTRTGFPDRHQHCPHDGGPKRPSWLAGSRTRRMRRRTRGQGYGQLSRWTTPVKHLPIDRPNDVTET
jgi:hypothetical protein